MANFLKKLFRKKGLPPSTVDTPSPSSSEKTRRVEEVTKPISPPTSRCEEQKREESPVEPAQLTAACAQSAGLERDHNEDALFAMTTTLASNGGVVPFGLYIVADGMGGHQFGEIASEIATRVMAAHVIKKVYINLFSLKSHPPEESLQEILARGAQKAHDQILQNVIGGGTTLTTVVIMGKQMTIAHVGDSRVYTISRHGIMKALTRDHSLVKRLEELGQITPEEAAIHPQRNVLYRALGQGEPFEPEIISAPLPPGHLLVCSDGLWGVVPPEEISQIVLSSPDLLTACQALVDAANEAGGPDNISAILVKLPQ